MDRPQSKPINADVKPASLKTKVALAVAAAAAAISPFTIQSEGTKHKAYLDPVKIPTICNGHTKGVKIGDVATDAQCEEYLKQDMESHMADAVRISPNLVNNHNVLMAVGDMTFNTGIGGYINSPVRKAVDSGDFRRACNSFPGWYTGATFDKPQSGLKCVPSTKKPGKFVCELKGLIARRLNEQKICLTGSWK